MSEYFDPGPWAVMFDLCALRERITSGAEVADHHSIAGLMFLSEIDRMERESMRRFERRRAGGEHVLTAEQRMAQRLRRLQQRLGG